jgi:UDP-N-acetylmuramate dehydrogenase
LNILENISLAQMTTLEVGGPACYFATARSESDILEAFQFARSNDLPVFILGGGTNVLISDNGFAGLVIQIALKGVSVDGETVVAAAGEDWDALVARCIERQLAGIECLSGIPGTVGGTPVQNVGAYGQEVSETIASVRCYDRVTNKFLEISNEACQFTYRTSIFNSSERNRYVVLSVAYSLKKNGDAKIVYKDLIGRFGSRGPSLSETREAVLAIRRSKSMVIDENDPNRRSAGSFFKNPIVAKARFDEIAASHTGAVPSFPASDGYVKIPAAWLIENSGFRKGYQMGKAGLSTNHTLAVINRGGANASDIVKLKNVIRSAVSDKFRINLETEPIFVGDFDAKN